MCSAFNRESKDPCLQTNDGVLKKASIDISDDSGGEEVAAEEDLFVRKERKKKKRRVTRELREFTGVSTQGVRKHKGWSDEGMLAFEEYVEAIRKDVEEEKYVAWENAYREVMEKLGHSKKNNEETLQRERYKQNLGVVYEGF